MISEQRSIKKNIYHKDSSYKQRKEKIHNNAQQLNLCHLVKLLLFDHHIHHNIYSCKNCFLLVESTGDLEYYRLHNRVFVLYRYYCDFQCCLLRQ